MAEEVEDLDGCDLDFAEAPTPDAELPKEEDEQ